MAEKQKQHGSDPSPEDIKKLESSIGMLTQRGAVRDEARNLLKVLGKENGWGLPKDHVEASIRVLGSFMKRPSLFQEDVEDLTRAFKQEEKFARVDWALKREAIGKKLKRAKDVTIAVAAIAFGAFSLYVGANSVVAWNTANTPEAIAQREIENQRGQERQAKIDAENARVLGLTPSQISVKGFRIHYNPKDKNVRYVEAGGELGFFAISTKYIGTKYEVSWKEKSNQKTNIETGIYASKYTRSDCKKIPALLLNTGYIDSNALWYLNDQPTEDLDNSVVVFENVKTQQEYFLAINVPDDPTGGDVLQFKLMKKVQTPSQ